MTRPLLRTAAVVLGALLAVVGLAGAAAAHVTVSSQDAAPGGFGKLTFRVPNESDTASTVGLRIQIPEEAAMASLRVAPEPGWTAETTVTELAEPLEAHGQEISEFVSVVEFTAEEGGGIAPGEFAEFELSGGPFPDLESVAYPTVQTYSDGNESAWIEPTVDGAEPQYPAPVLTLSGAAGGAHGADDADDAGGADGADGAERADLAEGADGTGSTPAAASSDAAGEGADGLAVTALVVGGLGLLAGLGGLYLGLGARRRTVGS